MFPEKISKDLNLMSLRGAAATKQFHHNPPISASVPRAKPQRHKEKT
jgi:hypothetical protein